MIVLPSDLSKMESCCGFDFCIAPMTHNAEHFCIPIYVGHLDFFREVLLRLFAHFLKTTLCYFVVDDKVLELLMYSRYESFAK